MRSPSASGRCSVPGCSWRSRRPPRPLAPDSPRAARYRARRVLQRALVCTSRRALSGVGWRLRVRAAPARRSLGMVSGLDLCRRQDSLLGRRRADRRGIPVAVPGASGGSAGGRGGHRRGLFRGHQVVVGNTRDRRGGAHRACRSHRRIADRGRGGRNGRRRTGRPRSSLGPRRGVSTRRAPGGRVLVLRVRRLRPDPVSRSAPS